MSVTLPRHMRRFRYVCLGAAVLCASATAAQPAKSPAAPPATPAPASPQQTTASFADWTLRCTRTSPTAQVCEVVQTITSQDRTVAQIAFGRAVKGQPMHLTILVPTSVTFATPPTLASGREGDAATLELAWRRCLPGGCMAESTVADDALRRVRGWTAAGRISFADGGGRAATLPFSPKGLPEALDALNREDAG